MQSVIPPPIPVLLVPTEWDGIHRLDGSELIATLPQCHPFIPAKNVPSGGLSTICLMWLEKE